MSVDLKTRLDRAVGDLAPRPVDTAAVWQRGRRQRIVRQVTPVAVVLLVVVLALGAVTSLAGGAREGQPLDTIDDRRVETTGWTVIEPGTAVTTEDLVAATPDDIETVTPLLGHPAGPHLFDVRDDGAVVTVFHDPDRGGLVVWHPEQDRWSAIGMPAAFLEDEGGYALHTIQWGPDGRIYVTGMAPNAVARGKGLTQVAVLEEDGNVVGVRENDDGQTTGFLFAGGYAWQQQTSDPGRQRWQPVAELGGPVLQMPDQRAGDREDVVAPDGMALEYDVVHGREQTFEARLGDDVVTWQVLDDNGIGVWPHHPAGLRVAATATTRPMGGPLGWLSDGREADGIALHVVDEDGSIAAVHLPAEVHEDDGGWGLVNGADGVIGGDGHVYWVRHHPTLGPALFRYRHPIP